MSETSPQPSFLEIINDSSESGEFEQRPVERNGVVAAIAQQALEESLEVSVTEHIRLTNDSLVDYFKNIAKVPLLTAEQEVEVARSIEVGLLARDRRETKEELLSPVEIRELKTLQRQGEASFEHLISANLRLVVSIAKRYQGSGMDFIDLIQEGNLGLIRAAESFDHTMGYKFSTYATWWIKQNITRSIPYKAYEIRIPVHAHEKLRSIVKVSRILADELGREPSVDEIAVETSLKPDMVRLLQRHSLPLVSLNAPIGNEGHEFGELIADKITPRSEDAVADSYIGADIQKSLDVLSEKEKKVITLAFGLDGDDPMPTREIAQNIGTTTTSISQIKKRAIVKLRNNTNTMELLQHYL